MTESGTDYLAEIADLTKLIIEGQDLVDQGNEIDLSNFENLAADLCRRMGEEPPSNPEEVTVAIEDLVTRLARLGDALRAQANQIH